MKEYIPLVTFSIGIILSIVSVFNREQEKGEKLQDEYFKILVSYFRAKQINKSLDIIDYFNRYKFKEICIPPYIFYLVDKNQREILEKVIQVDYWLNYPNMINNTFRVVDKFSRLMYFICIIAAFVVIGVCASGILFNMKFLIFYNGSHDYIIKSIGAVIASIFELIIIKVTMSFTKNMGKDIDEYNSGIRMINKFIKRKVKIYEKRKGKYYI